jgi:hypothetical protein
MKAMTTVKLGAVAAVTLATLAVPGRSEAGDSSYVLPDCVKYTDGSGYCRGSMKGFRNSSYADAWATFEADITGSWTYFFARYNNQYFSCYPNTDTSSRYASALAANGYFYVRWDSSATCTTLYVFNESSAY